MTLIIPRRLAAVCGGSPERSAWLRRLPDIIGDLARRWSVAPAVPFDGDEGSCAWVAPVTLAGGTRAVLKIGLPHFEAEHEIAGLRFWNGDPTVHLFEADDELGAMLLERCDPGTSLRALPEADQDVLIARLLRRIWRSPPPRHRFRPLSALTSYWRDETLARADRWLPDAPLIRAGLRLFDDLAQGGPGDMVLATDLHAGNVLRAEREPWLVIDPKPFVGDPAFDVTQHLLNSSGRFRSNPQETIRRLASRLEVNGERVRLWTFARAAAEPRETWKNDWFMELARALAP